MSVKIAVTLGNSSWGRANVVVESPIGTVRPSARQAEPSARLTRRPLRIPATHRGKELRGAPLQMLQHRQPRRIGGGDPEEMLGGEVDERQSAPPVHRQHAGADVPQDLIRFQPHPAQLDGQLGLLHRCGAEPLPEKRHHQRRPR
jgi:hypothetical protein